MIKNKERTIIFISHRLDNLDLFDNLLELENGTVKRYDKYGRYWTIQWLSKDNKQY